MLYRSNTNSESPDTTEGLPLDSINRKASAYGGTYDQLENETEDDNSLQTALSTSVDNILKNETIMDFYKKNKYAKKTWGVILKELFKFLIVGLGTLGIPVLLFIESLDDYEWVCLWGNSYCGSSEDYDKLLMHKLLITILFNICPVLIKIEEVL